MLRKRLEWPSDIVSLYFSEGGYNKAKYTLSFSDLLAEYFKGRKSKGNGAYPPNLLSCFLLSENLSWPYFLQARHFVSIQKRLKIKKKNKKKLIKKS